VTINDEYSIFTNPNNGGKIYNKNIQIPFVYLATRYIMYTNIISWAYLSDIDNILKW
jgi:hypothetical protein